MYSCMHLQGKNMTAGGQRTNRQISARNTSVHSHVQDILHTGTLT